MANVFYNRVIRKLVVGFGNLFNNITLVRYNSDESEAQRFLVPIAYAQKELYVQRLEGDPNLDKKVQLTLPRMSFEMTGFKYDASRKQNTNIKNFASSSTNFSTQYNPVPYDFDFSLNIYVRNIEDGTQMIEHILPYFTPDYTIKLNLIPEMGISKEIPVILNSTNQEIIYESNRDADPRMVIWTLNFTVKGFIYGAVSTAGVIKTSITNILSDILDGDVAFTMSNTGVGSYQPSERIYQGYSLNTATATAVVKTWSNTTNTLIATGVSGNFISNQPIIGAITNANHRFVSFTLTPDLYANSVTTATPNTANASSTYEYNTVITEPRT
jgi:hypothetical protein